MKYLIIYHKEDNDGVFSAAIAITYIKQQYGEDAVIDTIPADYVHLASMTKEDIDNWAKTYDNIIMTDISFNDVKMMKYIYEVIGKKFIWIDHHAPIIKASFTNGFSDASGERSTETSAMALAWKFFFDPLLADDSMPEIIKVLAAWDSFHFDNYPRYFAEDVNQGVTDYYKLSLPSITNFVNELVNNGENAGNVTYFMELGHTINQYDHGVMAQTIKDYGDFSWTIDGRPAVALFIQKQTKSTYFSTVKDKIRHAIVFKHKPNTDWVVSVYNTNDDDTFHCGDYLKEKYNGGGHAGAAGCTLSQEQFIKALKSKSL